MITAEDVLKDLDEIKTGTGRYEGKVATETDKLIEAVKVLVKVLITMRSNQMLPEDVKKAKYTAAEARKAAKPAPQKEA